ncbi:bifunctional phosphopantothenoylcysteine decarboxylase/phosphopantothenate--cysteine ligase CoaBC [Campylobacter corcagiensis]|uniref:Coenzyme A biosynthesis bifunctional protein CoaBC n=1 Tax=Campylobacter corcagiensis TaxID=1448857 RepID=A0A7M1LF28_9BACT|nr:bifunctional phosphopantothenoylcysteine decarboxylase/phosphopantothenate--cysteine ligase CoaBC [Campylobacter corcagiensis]QOQ87040.1 bifunctional phosphopantothenoylcysteine decarboxylase/phosphopantothenate--cysteine ligase CoaBC [Campylobacter corcagiensis]
MLKNKKILLAVCGSISFYKSYEIISKLKKLGASVYVTMSDGAMKFATPESFEAVSGHKVACSKTHSWCDGVNHIEYSKFDLVLIAPATVNTINKLAHGICDSIFLDILVASSGVPLLIAPAANERMLNHFSFKRSIEFLQENGAKIIQPVKKELVCGEIGKGALSNVDDIIYAVIREFLKDDYYLGRTVVITGGPTTEKIDDVRVISNLSSGKMSKALADTFYYLGANVVFITSVEFDAPYKIVKFDSSFGLQSALGTQKFNKGDILVMAAAVSDFIPNKVKGKLSKDDTAGVLTLNFRKNIDILTSVDVDGIKKIGFKLEVDEKTALENAKNMLKIKKLDAVCLNVLLGNVKFGSDVTKISFITDKKVVEIAENSKEKVAFEIANLIKSI